jgi:oxygen-independent coproporphyrinogen-3 oxidase
MKQFNSGLYIHVPFCSKRCSYCDFFSQETSDNDVIDEYGKKVIETIFSRVDEFEGEFSTIYIGGGSPSMLSASFFDRFQEEVLSTKKFENVKEFTVEINPADIDEPWLEALSRNGVNRISAGIQAMDARVLNEMGRRTKVADIKKNLPVISKLFQNISVDIIYGIGEKRVISNELREVFELADIEHVSAYQYTRPERANAPALINEDETLEQEKEIRDFLYGRGFEKYEISNYSKNGHRSLHNMIYWSYGAWLGIGAGAHSFNCKTGEHSFYQHDIAEFINGAGLSRFFPSKRELMEEFLLMGFRTVDGINMNKFRCFFGVPFEDAFSLDTVKELERNGLIQSDESSVRCTENGFDLLNSVLLKIFESGEK